MDHIKKAFVLLLNLALSRRSFNCDLEQKKSQKKIDFGVGVLIAAVLIVSGCKNPLDETSVGSSTIEDSFNALLLTPGSFHFSGYNVQSSQVTLNWTGAERAESYEVRYGVTNGYYPNTASCSSSPCTITGLTGGVVYYFTALARNKNGTTNVSSNLSMLVGVLANFSLNIPFSAGTASNYIFSDATVSELYNGVLRSTPADQADDDGTASGFGGGTLSGVQYDSTNNYLRLNTSTNNANLDASWTPKWGNIVAYWKFENNLTDSINGTKNGVAAGTGTSFSSSSKVGSYAFSSTGTTGSYVYFNNTSSFNISDVSHSFSAWFKTSATNGAVFSKGAGGGQTGGINAMIDASGYLQFYLKDTLGNQTYQFTSSKKYNDGNWHHVHVNYTTSTTVAGNNTASVYVDGLLAAGSVGTSGGVFGGNTTDSFAVGARGVPLYAAATSYFNGQIDEVAYWSTTLTASEVKTIYDRQFAKYSGGLVSRVMDSKSTQSWTDLNIQTTLPFFKEFPGSVGSESSADYSSLVGSTGSTSDNNLMSNLSVYWPLNNSLADASSTGTNTATSSGAVSYSSLDKQLGSHSMAFSSTGFLTYPNAVPFSTGDFSISIWFKVNGVGGGTSSTGGLPASNTLFAQRVDGVGAGKPAVVAFVNDTWNPSIQIRDNVGAAITAISANTITQGVWNHFLAIKTSTQLKVYVNGVLTRTLSHTFTGDFSAGVVHRFMGKHRFSGADYDFLNGSLDDVAIWTRALSAGEISQIYRRGANRLKYQIRTCSSADCSDQEALVNAYKGWKGPDNTGLSYFSEFFNKASNSATGAIGLTKPVMVFSNFTSSGLSVASNRYFQYRAILESEDVNSLCDYGSGATNCSPELKSISVGPNHYPTSTPYVTNKVSIGSLFNTLSGFTVTKGSNGCTGDRYSVSGDGTNFWYFNGSIWTTSNGSYGQTSTASQIHTNISSLVASMGTGTLQVRIYLSSDGTTACEIDNILVQGMKY